MVCLLIRFLAKKSMDGVAPTKLAELGGAPNFVKFFTCSLLSRHLGKSPTLGNVKKMLLPNFRGFPYRCEKGDIKNIFKLPKTNIIERLK